MTVLKYFVVAVLLIVLSQPVTAEASTTNPVTTEPNQTEVLPAASAMIQVGSKDSRIKFWQSNNPHDRQSTIYGLTALILIGTIATWARRRFY